MTNRLTALFRCECQQGTLLAGINDKKVGATKLRCSHVPCSREYTVDEFMALVKARKSRLRQGRDR